jgi:acyl-CoA synthetase (AMP-forming)/AMP-acid ligase II
MSFWALAHPAGDTAFVFEGRAVSYGELRGERDRFADTLEGLGAGADVGFIVADNAPRTLAIFLAALERGFPVALLPDDITQERLEALTALYEPGWIAVPPADLSVKGYRWHSPQSILSRHAQNPGDPHGAGDPRTAVMLATSGSTGSPKFVRLTRENLASNADAIVQYLSIDDGERAITTMPFAYSFGLSIINSHLNAGACIVFGRRALIEREFWSELREHRVTTLSGVPYSYAMMKRLRIEQMDLPHLRTLTQAGGRLDPDSVRHFAMLAGQRKWRFFVMYGQTEAAPRISYVPHDRVLEKADSIGVAVPGGRLSVDEMTGELIYEGPNVMLGYAASREDLGRPDELKGVLRTGDLGRVDEEGFFYVTGRAKRMIKLFGNRLNLDEVEVIARRLQGAAAAAVGRDDRLKVFVEREAAQDLARRLAGELRVHPSAVMVETLDAIPVTANGKIDYASLGALS